MATGEPVRLAVYDLSGGMARAFSQMLLGKQIDGVWHTAVLVGGQEVFFGGGINVARAGRTPFGAPVQVLELGVTHLDQDTREALLAELSERYTPAAYNLFSNNCNNFSDEYARLLCGAGVPAHITGLPAEVLATPFGAMLRPALAGLEAQLGGMQTQAVRPPPQAGGDAAPATAPAAARPGAASAAPALAAAEVEIDAAIAEGMIADAEAELAGLALPPGAGERLEAERSVRRETEARVAAGQTRRDAEVGALKAVARDRAAAAGNGRKPDVLGDAGGSAPKGRKPGAPGSTGSAGGAGGSAPKGPALPPRKK